MSNDIIPEDNQYVEPPFNDPYITGYHFAFFEDVHADLEEIKTEIIEFLPSTILSVNFDMKERKVSLNCLEFVKIPVYKLFSKIYDSKTAYDCEPLFNMLYCTTQPNGRTVEYVCKLHKLRILTPKQSLMNNFSHDICKYDKLIHEIKFSFEDYSESDYRSYCEELLSKAYSNLRIFEGRNQINRNKRNITDAP